MLWSVLIFLSLSAKQNERQACCPFSYFMLHLQNNSYPPASRGHSSQHSHICSIYEIYEMLLDRNAPSAPEYITNHHETISCPLHTWCSLNSKPTNLVFWEYSRDGNEQTWTWYSHTDKEHRHMVLHAHTHIMAWERLHRYHFYMIMETWA